MTAKEYLQSYKEYQRIADRKKEKWLAAAADLVSLPSSANYEDIRTGRNIHAQEDRIIKAQQKKEAWAIAELNALEVRQDVFGLIYDIDGVPGDILIERYIKLKKWEDVCTAVGLCRTQVNALHKDALTIVQQRVDKLLIG